MFTREVAINKVKDFTNELLDAGIVLDKVILYGSYARNQQKEDSDIDVALFSERFSGFGFDDKGLFVTIKLKDEYLDIETKTFKSKNGISENPFTELIEKTGIVIYKSNIVN